MERGSAGTTDEERLSRRYRVFGIVQGVGFRPFVSRLATARGLSGSVANKGPYVEILAQGRRAAMADFRRALTEEAPERSAVLRVAEEALPPFSADGFAIVESAPERGAAAHSAVRVAFTSQCSGPSVRTSKVHSPGSCAI